MSWQEGAYEDTSSFQAAAPENYPEMYHVTEMGNQSMYEQYGEHHYPPHSLSASGGVIYSSSNYFPPGAAIGSFSPQYPSSYNPHHSSYMMNDHFRQNGGPVNMNFMPGMPVQGDNYGGVNFSMIPREDSENNFHDGHARSDYMPNQRGKVHHPFRGRGRGNKFQSRGRGRSGYPNLYSYHGPVEMQNEFDDTDDYYYETPYYHSYSQRSRGRRSNSDDAQGGRGAYHYHSFQNSAHNSRLGDGDGKPQRRKHFGSKSNQHDHNSKEYISAKAQERSFNGNDSTIKPTDVQNSPQLLSQATERNNTRKQNSFDEDKRHRFKTKANQNRENSETDFAADGHTNENAKIECSSEKEVNNKTVVEFAPRNGSDKQDQAFSSRGRGRGRSNRGPSSRQFLGDKRYKNSSQWRDSIENDESQRGTLTEQLSTNKYECMVCCDNIQTEASVWSCQNCYHVFHLSCIQTWAQSSLCKETRSWRCPGCQNVSSKIPSQYRCFCGRRRDPVYIRGEIPHSCGEACRKRRKDDCKHPCTILCHPGPCPPCSAMIWLTCDCSKARKHVRCCTAVNFKCDKTCGKKLNCHEHTCDLVCHSGPCPPCAVSKAQECFCTRTTRKVMCGTEEFKMISFSCEKPCGRMLGCGNHVCEEVCHPGECAPCALMPGNLKSCSCGKTPLSELKAPKRDSCLDAVPTCGQICNKPMPCGSPLQPHLCDKKCHDGDCGPCTKETQLKCECGATEKKMPCELAVTYNEQNPFKCQRRCGKKKTCGRHKCSDTCCVKDIHICEIVCGQKLSCGIHKCEELCHRGNCKRCLQASFDELTCYCGAEVLEPPVPCGTRRPECLRLCTRQHNCDHPVRHFCHGEEDCPPCTELTDKMCVGGHMVRKNVPCHMTNISCGYSCNKVLPCGHHKCLKTCHKGDCLEDEAVCTQPCAKLRPVCGHPCGAPCHSGECPDVACRTEIIITCPCGNRTAKAACGSGGDLSADIAQFQRLSVQSMAESGGQSIDLSQFVQTKKSNKRLDCDTNCAIIERNRRLALALELKNPDVNAKLGNPTFTEFLKDFAKKNPKFAMGVEKTLNDLVQSAKQSAQANRSHAFQSMNRDQRRFVHELAEFYGCQTQSYDYEPNKNVVATAAKDKCWLPNVTLTQHVLKDQLPKAPPPISTFKTQGVTFTVLEKKKAVTKETPSSSRAWEETGATAASGASKSAAPIDYFDFTD